MPYALSVKETFLNRSIKVSTDRVRDYVRTFDVVVGGTDARIASPDLVLTAIGVPRRWDFYVSAIGTVDLYSTCRDVEARQDTQDPYLWRVTAHYSNKVDRPDINLAENPLLRPAEISYTSMVVERPLWKDLFGSPIENSSYERYDPPPTREEHILVLTIKKSQAAYDALFYLKYHGAVNSDTWFGFPKGRVKCAKIDGTRQFEAGFFHWVTTFEFHIRLENDEELGEDDTPTEARSKKRKKPDPVAAAKLSRRAWQLNILDRGYMELVGALYDGNDVLTAGVQMHLRDLRTGQPLTAPVLLNGNGSRLPLGDAPEWNYHVVRRQLKFSALQLF